MKTKEENVSDTYVEHFDMGSNGNPINAYPLTIKEANMLAQSLQTEEEMNRSFLKPKGILQTNILHINPSKGTVLWYTPAEQRQLYFVKSLDIPNGKAQVPPMLWFANKESLSVYVLGTDRRPTAKTPLYRSPFFNIYENGKVCMGTVNIDIQNSASVEEFTEAWETYFFNSYFSHLLGSNPINGNCVHIWKDLIGTDKPFPKEVLKKNGMTIKNLL